MAEASAKTKSLSGKEKTDLLLSDYSITYSKYPPIIRRGTTFIRTPGGGVETEDSKVEAKPTNQPATVEDEEEKSGSVNNDEEADEEVKEELEAVPDQPKKKKRRK